MIESLLYFGPVNCPCVLFMHENVSVILLIIQNNCNTSVLRNLGSFKKFAIYVTNVMTELSVFLFYYMSLCCYLILSFLIVRISEWTS